MYTVLLCCSCNCSLNKKSEKHKEIEANLNCQVEELRQRIQQMENNFKKYLLMYLRTYNICSYYACTYVCAFMHACMRRYLTKI